MSTETDREAALQLIEQAQQELAGVRARWDLLDAFAKELHSSTRGQPFVIASPHTWQLIFDGRDQMVVHFAAWARSAYEPSGFFGKLGAQSGRPFYVKTRHTDDDKPQILWAPDSSPSEVSSEKKMLGAGVRQTRLRVFEARFPAAHRTKRPPNAGDFDSLKNAFEEHVRSVIDFRDNHCAHPPYGPSSTAIEEERRLGLDGLRDHMDFAFGLLNDLRTLCARSSLGGSEPAVQEEAKDLVDQVLFGSRRRLDVFSGLSQAAHDGCGRFAHQFRDSFYDSLHKCAKEEGVPFNDPQALEALRRGRDASEAAGSRHPE